MEKIKVLIVEDEPLARKELTSLLSKENIFDVLDYASNGRDALDKLKALNGVQVVFLDIDMPIMNGIETARRLADWVEPPLVVFATAYHQYAVEAFQANAMDYLLKPYDPALLSKTCQKIKKMIEMKTSHKLKLQVLSKDLEFIDSPDRCRLSAHTLNHRERVYVDLKDIYYFHAHYTEVMAVLKDSELFVDQTLKELTEQFADQGLMTCHKSHVVQINHISKITPALSDNYKIYFDDASLDSIPLSRRFAKTIQSVLKKNK